MDAPGLFYPYPYGEPVGSNEMLLGFKQAEYENENQLTESRKEQIIMQCWDAESDKKVEKIVKDNVPDGNINSLFEGPSIG